MKKKIKTDFQKRGRTGDNLLHIEFLLLHYIKKNGVVINTGKCIDAGHCAGH